MRPGTIVRLPDGRDGTVVYHGLDGYGIRWGRHEVDEAALKALLSGGPLSAGATDDAWRWLPEAMLRAPRPGSEIECVGGEFTVVED